MARLSYSGQALADLERISDFLAPEGMQCVIETLDLIEEAIALLRRHPLIGRLAEPDLRGLVISQGRTGYVALYSYEKQYETVLILAIRHQREAGFLVQT